MYIPVLGDGDLGRQGTREVFVGGGYEDVMVAFSGAAGHVPDQNVPEHCG